MTNFNRSQLKYIWLLFALMFFILAYFHFRIAAAEIKHFQSKGQVKTINGLPLGVAETVYDLNAYIDQINQSNKKSNILAGGGYLAAMFTALLSFFLDSKQHRFSDDGYR